MILAMVPTKALAVENAELADPKVTHLTVSYDGGEPIEILGAQPTISLPIGSKPVFTVAFDNNALLNKVFVTSTKDGETKYLEATRQGNQYVTDGYFDPNDTSYIPGTIAVTYSKKTVEVTERTQIGEIDLTGMKQELETQGASVNGEITTGNDGSVNAQVVLDNYFSGIGETFVNASIKELTSSAGINSDEVRQWVDVYDTISSYALKGEDGKDYMLYFTDKDWTDANSYIMLVHDISGNKYVQMSLKGAKLKEIAEKMSQENKLVGTYLDYVAIGEEMDSLREDIEANPMMTPSQKAEANKKIDALENDKKLFMMGVTFIPFFLGAAGVTVPLMFTALLAGYSSTADYFWEHRIGMIKGCGPLDNIFTNSDEHGIGLTNEVIKDNRYTLTKSGTYYLAEDCTHSPINIGSSNEIAPPIDVTLCLHGTNLNRVAVYNNSTLHLCDCKYVEQSDGTAVGGCISEGISCKDGTAIIREGIVGNVLLEEKGRLIINGGILQGGGLGTRASLSNNGGQVTMNSGTLAKGIDNHGSGIVKINGGSSRNILLNQEDSDLIILGGTIQKILNYGVATINGGLFVNEENNGVIENEDSGNITIKRGSIEGEITNKGIVAFTGGTLRSNAIGIINRGNFTISGGAINAPGNPSTTCAVNNVGMLKITGGTINADESIGIANSSGGVLQMSGGTINNSYIGITTNSNTTISGNTIINASTKGISVSGGTLTISGCKINTQGHGVERTFSDGTIMLLIQNDSFIEVKSPLGFKDTPIVQNSPSYSGGITYFSSPDAQGTKMTIQEAASIDYEQPYVRLAADDATGGPSGGSITLPDGIKDALADGTAVFAASYRGDMLVECVRGTAKDGKAVFSRKIPAGWTLFFLNPVSLTPLCGPIVL